MMYNVYVKDSWRDCHPEWVIDRTFESLDKANEYVFTKTCSDDMFFEYKVCES